MASAYRLVERPPTIEEYRSVCHGVGWKGVINFAAASVSLTNSLYHVVALSDEGVIGMARVVGDGAMYFYIQDVAVVPAHQGRRGRRVVDGAHHGLSPRARPGESIRWPLRCRRDSPFLRAL